MREAVKEILQFGFYKIGFQIIEGEVEPENLKSIKLMRKFNFILDSTSNITNNKTVFYKLEKQNFIAD